MMATSGNRECSSMRTINTRQWEKATDLKVDWIAHLLSVYNKEIEAGSQAHFRGGATLEVPNLRSELIHFTIEKLLFSQIITI